MANGRLNLTRDQLAAFLQDHQQIKQFELLFSVVDAIAPNVVQEINIATGTAQSTANNALDQIIELAQSTSVDDAVMSAKVQQALDCIPRLTQALELLALAPASQPQQVIYDDLAPPIIPYIQPKNGEFDSLTVTGTSNLGAGTVTFPSVYLANETGTGLYRIGPNNHGYAVSGVNVISIASTGIALTVPIQASTVKATAAGGYISSDNSTGITTTITTASLVGKTITIKDGLITSFA